MQYWIYLAIMAISTYLIRAVPFALVQKKITSPFLRSFLYYIPYAVLTAMTIPAIFYSTGSLPTAIAGTATLSRVGSICSRSTGCTGTTSG